MTILVGCSGLDVHSATSFWFSITKLSIALLLCGSPPSCQLSRSRRPPMCRAKRWKSDNVNSHTTSSPRWQCPPAQSDKYPCPKKCPWALRDQIHQIACSWGFNSFRSASSTLRNTEIKNDCGFVNDLVVRSFRYVFCFILTLSYRNFKSDPHRK